jgi:hypothetical protein
MNDGEEGGRIPDFDLRSIARLHEVDRQLTRLDQGRRLARYVLFPAAAFLLFFLWRNADLEALGLERALGLTVVACAAVLSIAQSVRAGRARLAHLRAERMALAAPSTVADTAATPVGGRLFGRR